MNNNLNEVIYNPWRYQVEFVKNGVECQSINSRCFSLDDAHAHLENIKKSNPEGYDFKIVERIIVKKTIYFDSETASLI